MIIPRVGYILLEVYTPPVDTTPGRLILPDDKKYTQIYRVLSDENDQYYCPEDLVYVKGYPTLITQKDKTYYLAEEENIIAKVVL